MPDWPDRLIVVGLVILFLVVIVRLPAHLPFQVASWLTFVALLIMPGYLLADLLTGSLNLDQLERLALAFPLGTAVIALPGMVTLLFHLTVRELAIGWMLTVLLILGIWLVYRLLLRRGRSRPNTPWTWDEVIMLLLLVAAFVYIFPTLSVYKIDGDAYTFLAFVREALTGRPMNVTEPLFGTALGPGVRVAFNQFVSIWTLWAYFSELNPVDFTALATRSVLALWTILASYTLGKAAGDQRRFGLFTVSIQLLILMAAPFFRDDNVSSFFFENIHADKFVLSVAMLPVVFALTIYYIRQGRLGVWLAAAIAALAVSTIHPLIAAMLALALAAFGGLHLLLNLRRRVAWIRVSALAVLVAMAMFLPFVQLLIAQGSVPLAPTFPRSFEGWSIGEKMFPVLPFLSAPGLDVYGPLPDLAHLEAEEAGTDASPFLIWRFALNMRRQRLILFDLDHYISDPSLIMEPPYLLSLVLIPLLLWRLRSQVAAQFVLSTNLAVVLVMFNPLVTPLVGSLVVPWILWRIVWLLPYALTIALVTHRFLNHFSLVLARQLKVEHAERTFCAYGPLGFIIIAGLLLSPGIVVNLRELHHRAAGPRLYPAPEQILARLDQETARTGPVTVAADQNLSVTIPAYVANANVIAHRIFNISEIFPADQQDKALQRLIDQHRLFQTALLTPATVEILQRYNVHYLVVSSGSDLDMQLQLAPHWFERLLADQAYSLYGVKERPAVTASLQGNEALNQRQWETAQRHYRAALQQAPADLLAWTGLAETYRVQGQFDLAVQTLEQALTQVELPGLYYRLGQIYAEIGQLERSLTELNQAQQTAPLTPRFHLALGDACLDAGQAECAGQQYEAAVAVEEFPDEAARLMALADIWRQRNQPTQALPLYEQAVALRPDQQSRLLLSGVYQDLEQFDRAEAVLQILRAERPFSAEVLFRLARLKASQGAVDQAIALYRQAIGWQSLQIKDTTSTRLALAQTLLEAGRLSEAQSEIERILAVQPFRASAYMLLGNLYHAQEQPVTATMAYQQALQLDPTEVTAYLSLSNQYRQYAVIDENLALLQRATQDRPNLPLNPDQAALFLFMGDQLQRLGNPQAAIAVYQFALGLLEADVLPARLDRQVIFQRRALAYTRLATLYEDLGELQLAMNYYHAAAVAASTKPGGQVRLADAMRRRNDVAAAEAIYRQAIQTDPTYMEAYLRLADLLSSRGNPTAAAELYEQALRIVSTLPLPEQPSKVLPSPDSFSHQIGQHTPNFGSGAEQEVPEGEAFENMLKAYLQSLTDAESLTSLAALARLLIEAGQTDEAVQLYRQRIQAGEQQFLPTVTLARYYKDLGDVYLTQHQLTQAGQAYQQAISLDGWWPGARLGFARALSEQGDQTGALDQLQTAADIAPGSIEVQLVLAEALDQQGNKDQALVIYQAIAHTYPGHVRANLALAQAWQERGRWAEAEQSYRQIIALTPNNAAAYAGLAGLYSAQARYAEAEPVLQQAVQLDHHRIETYLQLGELMIRLTRYSEAVAALEQAQQIEPGNWRGYAGLARVQQALGRIDLAIDSLNQATMHTQTTPQPWFELAALYRDQNQPNQAEDALLQAAERFPENVEVHRVLADLYLALALNDEALIQLRQAVQENPSSMEALIYYADELRRQGRLEEAELLYRRAEQAGEASVSGYRALVAARQAQGRLAEALTLVGRILANDPYEPVNWILNGQLQAQLGDQAAALASLQQATKLAPNQGQTWSALGDALLAAGQQEQAVAALEQAIAVDPTYLPAYGTLVQTYRSLNQTDQASQAARLAQQASPGSYLSDIYVARTLQDRQQWAEARATLNQALIKAPGVADPLIALGELERLQGQVELALAWYEQAANLRPRDRAANIQLVDFLLGQGDNELALAQVQLALENWPGNAELVLRLGQVERRLGQFTEAESAFLRAARLNQADSRPYAELAALHLAQGKLEAAVAAYQQAIILQPTEEAYYLELSRAWSTQGQADQALNVLTEGLSSASRPASLYAAIAALYRQRDEPQLALETLERARQSLGEDSQLLQALGAHHQARAEFEQAEQVYNRLLALYPDQAAAHTALADFYLDRGRISDALTHYEQAAALEPGQATLQLALGNAYRLTGRRLEATTTYSQALRLDPTLAQTYLNLASLYQTQARWEDVRALYETGLAAAPTSAPVLAQYSAFLSQRGDQAQALKLLDQAIQRSPGIETLSARAALYRALGRPTETERDLLRAVKLAPGSATAQAALGDFFQAQGDEARATLAYRQAITLAPGLALGYLGLADVAYNQGQLDKLWSQFDLALKAEPASTEAWLSLAEARRSQGDWVGAEAAYRQLMTVAPLNTEAYLGLAEVSQRRSADLEKALAWLDQADQLGIDHSLIYRALGDAYRAAGQSSLSDDYFQQIIDLEPGRPDGYLALVELYLAQGLPQQAELYARQAVEVAPGDPSAYIALGNVFYSLGDLVTAEQNYRSAIDLDATRTDGHVALAQMYVDQKQFPEAVAIYQQAIQQKASNWSLLIPLGEVYIKMSTYDEAQLVFEQVAAMNPAITAPWLHQGDLYLLQANEAAAQGAFEQAGALRPNEAEPFRRLAQLAQQQDYLDEAERYLRQAIMADPIDAASYELLGDVLAGRGDKTAAIESYRMAVQLDPRRFNAYQSWSRLHVDKERGRALTFDTSRLEAALVALTNSPDSESLWAQVMLAVGYQRVDEGITDRVITYLETASDLDPVYLELYQQLALAYEEQSNQEAALGAWHQYLYAARAGHVDAGLAESPLVQLLQTSSELLDLESH